MPAVREANWFAPTARRRKPRVLRLSSQPTNTAASSAMIRPAWTRRSPPSSGGSRAFLSVVFEIAWPYGGAWKPFFFSR